MHTVCAHVHQCTYRNTVLYVQYVQSVIFFLQKHHNVCTCRICTYSMYIKIMYIHIIKCTYIQYTGWSHSLGMQSWLNLCLGRSSWFVQIHDPGLMIIVMILFVPLLWGTGEWTCWTGIRDREVEIHFCTSTVVQYSILYRWSLFIVKYMSVWTVTMYNYRIKSERNFF